MAQYEMNLRDYWRIVRRRRVAILASTILVAVFSFRFAKQKVPTYLATASVRFEQSTSVTGLLIEVLSFSPGNDPIETQATIIKSFPVLEQVAKRLGKLPATSATAAIRESKAYTAVIDSLASRLKTGRVGGTNIIEISATSTSPREARDTANAVAQLYKEYAGALRNVRITDARMSAIARRTAPSAFTSPAPCSKTENPGIVCAVCTRSAFVSEGVRPGLAWSIIETTRTRT